MSVEKKSTQTGAAHNKRHGLVAVAVNCTPAEREVLRQASALTGVRSMGAFTLAAALDRAAEVLKEKGVTSTS